MGWGGMTDAITVQSVQLHLPDHFFCLWFRNSSTTWIPWCTEWVFPEWWWWWWLSRPLSPPSDSEKRLPGGRNRRPEHCPPARWRWRRCSSATPSCSSSACRPFLSSGLRWRLSPAFVLFLRVRVIVLFLNFGRGSVLHVPVLIAGLVEFLRGYFLGVCSCVACVCNFSFK